MRSAPFRAGGLALASLILVPLAGAGSHPARWGRAGHQAIAMLAAERLSPGARERLQDLLAGQGVGDASTWADSVRPARPATEPLHYVNIPIWAPRYEPERYCPEGRCVLGAITHYRAVLADPGTPALERTEALKFLIHFVSDLHQPLHVADRGDRGGNDVRVGYRGRGTSLHSLWDTGLVEAIAPDGPALAEQLRSRLAALPADSVAAWSEGTPEDWAMGLQRISREVVYRLPPEGGIDAAYVAATHPIVERQLLQAVLRLAAVLEAVLAPR